MKLLLFNEMVHCFIEFVLILDTTQYKFYFFLSINKFSVFKNRVDIDIKNLIDPYRHYVVNLPFYVQYYDVNQIILTLEGLIKVLIILKTSGLTLTTKS